MSDRFEAARQLLTKAQAAALEAMQQIRAESRTDPEFPAWWGEPIAHYWLQFKDGKERTRSVEPKGLHLTIWRFKSSDGEPFEVTATFDRLDQEDWQLRLVPNEPPGKDWEIAGKAHPFSSLWRRPFDPRRNARLAEASWGGHAHE